MPEEIDPGEIGSIPATTPHQVERLDADWRCGAETKSALTNGTLICEKPYGHEGMHGCGPFTEWTVEWPREGP